MRAESARAKHKLNPQKLKSINGVSIIWLEECSECKYEAYKELLGRLRHMECSNHIICSTNPVGTDNWTYSHFFKDEESNKITLDDFSLYNNRIVKTNNTYYHHSTCEDNAFLPQSYIEELEQMKTYDYDLYRVAKLGHYGVNGEKVLPQFKEMDHEQVMAKVGNIPPRLHRVGLDLGFVTSYNSLVRVAIDESKKDLYIYEEYYTKGITDDIIATDLLNMNISNKIIYVDCSEPKTIAYLQQRGLKAIPCKKFAGSVISNIKKIKRFKNIYCSSNCKNAIKELKYLTYKKDRKGNVIENEFNIDSHIFDSIAYSLDGYEVTDVKQFNRNKYGI